MNSFSKTDWNNPWSIVEPKTAKTFLQSQKSLLVLSINDSLLISAADRARIDRLRQTIMRKIRNDGVLDIALTLEKMYTVSAKITFEKISEEVSERIGVESPIDDSLDDTLPPQPGEAPVVESPPAADRVEDTIAPPVEEMKRPGQTILILAVILVAVLAIYFFLIKPRR